MRDDAYVYILVNRHTTVMYVGITRNVERRLIEHRTKPRGGLTWKSCELTAIDRQSLPRPKSRCELELEQGPLSLVSQRMMPSLVQEWTRCTQSKCGSLSLAIERTEFEKAIELVAATTVGG